MDFPRLRDYPHFALDVETTALEFWKAKLFAFSIALPDDQDFYFDIRRTPQALEWLRDEMPHVKAWIAHNAKYECHILREAGVVIPEDRLHCTMIREALLDEHRHSYDLDSIGWDRLQRRKADIWPRMAELFGGEPTKDAQILNLVNAPFELASEYGTQDSRLCLDIFESQESEMAAQRLGLVYRVERDLVQVLVDIEYRGVRVDIPRAEKAVDELTIEIDRQQKELDAAAGFPINPNPSKSISELFKPTWDGQKWTAIDGTGLDKTPAGKPSFNKEALQRMRHPCASMILQVRELKKTRDTFLLGHILGSHVNGVIHANFNQTKSENDMGTGTGRLSVNAPALQQIHKRNEKIAAIVRSCFIPDEGHDWHCHDWAQMDFRMFAHYVNNPRIIAAYAANPDLDYHQQLADETGLPRKPTPGIKGNAKQINLGLVFGMGPGKLAREMGLPYTVEFVERFGKEILKAGPEAEAILANYYERVPGVREFLRTARDVVKDQGFVRTILGRCIRFPGGDKAHKSGGLVFQGSAADALKRKLFEVWRYLKGTNGRLLLNVHDEFDNSLPKGDEGVRLAKGITEIVETFTRERSGMEFRVPIRSDHGMGPNWWEASK